MTHSTDKIYSPAWRFRKAYRTALVVMSSYGWLTLRKKIFGKAYYEKRILALHLRNAGRVKTAILELNGLFIKIGQMLSVLSNFLPEAFQKPLEELQDRIPARPFSEVRERLLKEFGKTPEALFAKFEETPIAAASIGQAHRATLPNGAEVVVKVQHANIETVAQVDLEIIRRLNNIMAWFFDIKGMDYLYSQVRKMIEEELDFAREATSMQRIAQNLRDEPQLFVPAVQPDFCTGRVLTTTWHEGVKISNTGQLDEWGLDRSDLAARLLRAYCRMVFRDGFYHADPHPGNILVKQDGAIVLLDFGAVAVLGKQFKEGIPQLIEAAVKNDADAMIEACHSMGFIAEGREAEEMAEKIIQALRNFLQNEVKLEGLNFKDIEVNPFDNSLFDLIREVGFSGISGTVQVPKDYVLLNRMVTLLLGICNMLDPKLNPLEVVRPYVKEYVADGKQDLVAFVTGLLRRSAATALGLPSELHQALQLIRKGKVEVRTPDIRAGARLLYMAGQQFIFTLLIMTAGAIGYLFRQSGEYRHATYSFCIAGFFSLLLLRSLRAGGKIRRRLE
jgi:predicted unusual protein kinase regulating ubiquinone biosynthesis (AarF/ABC1/UbiB family)